jgi:ubiquinol-cytochrome c reductase cytochrome c subunit
VAAALTPALAAQPGDQPDPELVEAGRQLYRVQCISCHGPDGGGEEGPDGELRGPSLENSGEAAAYYYLHTGRMPLANSEEQPTRKSPAYDEEQIEALVAYVASLGDGPALPDVDSSEGDLARGGVIYRENCQACHSASGAGGALSYGRAAPSLEPVEPDEIGAAVRIGPNNMPVFGPETISSQELDDLARYVEYLRDPADPGGVPIGRIGPIPEGFVAWGVGMVALLVLTAWIGTRAAIRRRTPT